MTLNEFLVKAKCSTYATAGENTERKLSDGSRELKYNEGKWRYRDRYFGFNPFIGQEVVWENKKPIWAMNYNGKVLVSFPKAKVIYEFLKEAMRRVKEQRPFRGPLSYRRGDFIYKDRSIGNMNLFVGKEEILFKNKKIYELNYHGGIIEK